MKMYAIRDRATDQYLQPMFLLAHGQAIRTFSDDINKADSPAGQHPEDYDLYYIGTYDTDTGKVEENEPQQIAIGKDLKTKVN